MRNLSLYFIFLLVLFSNDVFAQKEGVVHPRFRALLNSGERIEGRDGYFTSTTFNGILNTGEEISVGRSDIKALDVSSGSKTLQYAGIGAGFGLLSSLLGVASAAIQASNDPYRELNTGAIIPITLVVTGTSALIGGIIGANQTKWTRVPIRTTLNFEPKEKGAVFMVYIPFN